MEINLTHALHYQNEARYYAYASQALRDQQQPLTAKAYQDMAAYNAAKARRFMGLEE